jgi:hypothetical protein
VHGCRIGDAATIHVLLASSAGEGHTCQAPLLPPAAVAAGYLVSLLHSRPRRAWCTTHKHASYLPEYLQHLSAAQLPALHRQPVKLIKQGTILQDSNKAT